MSEKGTSYAQCPNNASSGVSSLEIVAIMNEPRPALKMTRCCLTGTQDDTVLLDSFNDFAPKVMKLVFEQCPHDGDFLFPNITLAAYEDALKIANQ